jgi:hypothetical protein
MSWPNNADGITEILAGLEPEELDVLADMDRAEIATLIEQARTRRATAERLTGRPGSVKVRVTLIAAYDAEGEKQGRPGRIILRGAGPSPVEIWLDGKWQPVEDGLALPDGFEGKGQGWWQNYSLQPTSAEFAPINWVRWNRFLALCGAVHGPDLSPEQYAALPAKALRSASRKPIVLAYLLGGQNPELDGQ